MADLVKLIDENPFAWIVAVADPAIATPMPLLFDPGDEETAPSLIGHLPRRHPLVATLTAAPQTLSLFQGPHAYISPEFAANRNWAPTWNFVVAKLLGDTRFDETLTDEALRRLVNHMERSRSQPWSTSEMESRYEQLRARVIGFRIENLRIEMRLKLGQDEREETFASIVDALGPHPIAAWMAEIHNRPPER